MLRDSQPSHPISPALDAVVCAVIFAAALFAYLPTLRYEFLTSWDDPTYIVNNPWIRGWSRENLLHAFTKPYFANYLPLHLVSYMVDYGLWGLKPFGFHLHAVLLNALNAVLAMFAIRRLLGNQVLAFIGALLFALHPSHVEAVAWVSIRKDLLSTTFLFLTLIFYLRAMGRRSIRWGPYVASIACFALGLLSKVSIAALPLFLLLVDSFQPAGRPRPRWIQALVNKIPYGLAALLLVTINSLVQVKAQAPYAHDLLRYFMVKGHAVWNYLGLLTGIPHGRPIYDTPYLALDIVPVVVNLAGIGAIPAVLVIAMRRNLRAVALGAGWMFTMLLPAIAQPVVTYMADRYLYAASLGFCWIMAAVIVAIGGRMATGLPRAGIAALLTVIPVVGFAYRTAEYNSVWRNSETLWTYAITQSKDYRAHNNLAQVRLDQKRWSDAERLYQVAAQAENIVSHQGLATVYYDTQRYQDAERAIDRALDIAGRKGVDAGDLADLEYTRGAIYWVQSRPERAIKSWEAALRADPRHERAREWLQTARGGSTQIKQ